MNAWQLIETAPRDVPCIFWIRAVTIADWKWYADTSGNPIVAHTPPRLHFGLRNSWNALMVATHWMPLPEPP